MLYRIKNNQFYGFYNEVLPIFDEDQNLINEKDILIADDKEYFDITIEERDELIRQQNEEYKEIIYKDKKLIAYLKPPCLEKFVKKIFNYETESWEEGADLEEQIEYYKNLIIQRTREHELLKISGFTGTQEEINLQTEIEDLKQKYLDLNHKLALQIENRLK